MAVFVILNYHNGRGNLFSLLTECGYACACMWDSNNPPLLWCPSTAGPKVTHDDAEGSGGREWPIDCCDDCSWLLIGVSVFIHSYHCSITFIFKYSFLFWDYYSFYL